MLFGRSSRWFNSGLFFLFDKAVFFDDAELRSLC